METKWIYVTPPYISTTETLSFIQFRWSIWDFFTSYNFFL